MAIADLNIRLGADLSGLRRDLRAAERALRATGERFNQIGRDLTMNLSAPMALFGGLAVKTAGEFEALRKSMETTFESNGRSAAEAHREVELLRQAAMAPGLDFEQAVRGSVRLQNVGFAAEEARGIIVELANAIAMSGGTAENLDGVTKQFGQMVGKGRILQEDLTIILENMPVLSRVMKDTFGTATAEGLRKAGVGVEEFVLKITESMKELPRVSGGISNTIVNIGSSVKNFLAQIGEDLNKSLNLQELGDRFGKWLDGLARDFKNLDTSTKEWIVKLGLLAVSLGPVLIGISAVMKASAFLQTVWLGLKIMSLELGTVFTALGVRLAAVRAAFLALNMSLQIGILGAVAIAVTALVMAFQSYNRELSTAQKVAKTLEDVQTTALKNTVNERIEGEKLIAVIQDENAGREAKARALNELKKIQPEYFGNLSIEKNSVEDITAAYARYTNALLMSAKAAAAREKIIEIEKQIIDLQEKGLEVGAETFVEGLKWKMGLKSINDIAADSIKKRDLEIAGMREQQKALTGLVIEGENFGIKTAANTGKMREFARATQLTTEQLKEQKALLEAKRESDKNKAAGVAPEVDSGTSPAALMMRQVTTEANLMNEVMGRMNESAAGLNLAFEPTTNMFLEMSAAIAAAKGEFGLMMDIVSERGAVVGQVMGAMGAAVAQAAEQGATSLKDLAKAALAAAAKIIRAQIMEAVTVAALKALKSVPFPFNIAAAGAAAGAAGALFNGLINKVGIPALAEGGIASGPTMAMVGEYAGAKSNPEVIAPLNKLRGMLRGEMGGGFGGVLESRIRGNDLLLVMERAQQNRTRARGY